MSWRKFFPDYQVPKAIDDLVSEGHLVDKSAPNDPGPSFVAKLTDGSWGRLWIEHPDYDRRRAGPHRFHVEITRDLDRYGRPLIEDDSLDEIWPTFYSLLMVLGQRNRFRLMGSGSRGRYSQVYEFGRIRCTVRSAGDVGGRYYFQVKLEAPGISPRYISSVLKETRSSYFLAAVGAIQTLHEAHTNPEKFFHDMLIAGAKESVIETIIQLADDIGPHLARAMHEVNYQETLAYRERGPREWFPRPQKP